MKKLLFALSLLLPTPAFASACDNLFPNGREIVVPNTVVLCNSFFVTVYDDEHNATIFSSEVAQPRVRKVARTNDFRADRRIKDSPTPEDYTNSGYDRGHMAAAANADDPIEMSESFLMTNMTPQVPYVNRVAWRNLEDRVRSTPFVYVVTGAIYPPNPRTIGRNRVPVPSALWKVSFFADGKTAVYVLDNVDKAQVRTMSLEELESLIGYKLR